MAKLGDAHNPALEAQGAKDIRWTSYMIVYDDGRKEKGMMAHFTDKHGDPHRKAFAHG